MSSLTSNDASSTSPKDADARQQAIDTSQSWIVTAPAGSGKTGLLTLRVLSLLAKVAQPEEILCVTFTNKAAQEMRERVLESLEEAATLDQNALNAIEDPHNKQRLELAWHAMQNDQEQGWKLLQSPLRLKVQTIDSFCRQLNRQSPVSSGAGLASTIIEDADTAYQQAVRYYVEDALNKDDDNPLNSILLPHFDGNIDRIVAMLVQLLGSRDQWLPLIYQARNDQRQALQAATARWNQDSINEVVRALKLYEGDLCQHANYAAEQLIAAGSESPICQLLGVTDFASSEDQDLTNFWQPLLELLLKKDGDFRKALNKNCGFPAGIDKESKALAKQRKESMSQVIGELGEIDGCLEALQAARQLAPSHYDDDQWQVLSALLEVLPSVAAHLQWVFAQMESTDFVQISLAALNVLGHDNELSDLAARLDYQLTHILIDEFQDTSATQLRLLERLTESWYEGDGKTLFVVGDGMQSCYGFRNANVGIFLGIKRQGLPTVVPETLDLCTNFRSSEQIVSWVNQVFAEAFPKQDDIGRGAVRYTPSVAFKSTDDDQSSYIKCQAFVAKTVAKNVDKNAGDAQNGPNPRVYEADYIAEQIKHCQQYFPEDSIAVLVKNRAHLNDIMHALQQQHIPYDAIDLAPLGSKQEIIDLLSLTRALHDPSDTVAWLALLRSPWCGLPLHDLYAIAQHKTDSSGGKRASNLWLNIQDIALDPSINTDNNSNNRTDDKPESENKPPPADLFGQREIPLTPPLQASNRAALQRFVNTMLQALQRFRRQPLTRVIEMAWLALGGPQCLEHERELDNVTTFFSQLEKCDQGGMIGNWEEFERSITRLYAQTQSGSANAVQLMTMHKSKGLEFDTVFVPALERTPRNDDPAILYWLERINSQGSTDLLMSPIASSKSQTPDPLANIIRREKKIHTQLESTRLLYVACTRAKKRLYLSAVLNQDKNDQIKAPADTTMLGKFWSILHEDFTTSLNNPLPSTTSTQEVSSRANVIDTNIYRLQDKWQAPVFDFGASNDHYPLVQDFGVQSITGFDAAFDQNDAHQGFATREHRAEGTLFHRILKRLTEEGLAHWNDKKISQMHVFWSAQLAQLGVSQNKHEAILQRFSEVISAFREDEKSQWLFNHSHQDSACELEVLIEHEDSPTLMIIDRTFVDQGLRWIVDYKTATPSEGESIDAFTQKQSKRYRNQLSKYASAFRLSPDRIVNNQTDTKKIGIKTALFFPYIRHLHIVEP
ncbi:MAG: hypothetical protein COA42_20730 [Alteromonadaceae bacterium]|nr:MAG: hypothetical protein COA42_20730 [Alteromonadaceae bacterium]